MTLIHVPRPPKNAMDPNRPVNALLKTQIEHLYLAEKRLPLRYHTDIYVNAIKTEGEAANYIRQVTEAIHQAHADAAKGRARQQKKWTRVASASASGRSRKPKSSGGKPKTKRAKPRGRT
jgi:hypothetical protein